VRFGGWQRDEVGRPPSGSPSDPPSDPPVDLGVRGTPSAASTGDDATLSTRYLLERLALLERRVSAAALAGQEETPDRRRAALGANDPIVARLLDDGAAGLGSIAPTRREAARLQALADEAQERGHRIRLQQVARAFHLDEVDVDLLLLAIAPALDPRFETYYAVLHDDPIRRRATVGLALSLVGLHPHGVEGRARLSATGPLVGGGLVAMHDPDLSLVVRGLGVPDRVVSHLLGDDRLHPMVAALRSDVPPTAGQAAGLIARAFAQGIGTIFLSDPAGVGGAAQAVAGLLDVGAGAIVLDLDLLEPTADVGELAFVAQREVRLLGSGLVVGPVEVLAERGAGQVRAFADSDVPTVLVGRGGWDPTWARRLPVLVDADRVAATRDPGLLPRLDPAVGDVDLPAALGQFRLTPEQLERAVASAVQQAALEDRGVTAADLQRGARAQNAAGLDRLSRRVTPRAAWSDLVLPAEIEAQLRQLAVRWRHRDRVLDDWGLGRGSSRGRGVTALFAGDSGTGKTMSAEVVAGELGLDLYVVDLSTVVDKYIGETSKNLERIFREADRVNGVLLFDEADALFGKRSGVSDAKDRHANVEVAYLLQRMEAFDGVAILTTNLAANIDEAFIRRLDAIVDFPTPDDRQREQLWRAKLDAGLPQEPGLDVEYLAGRFRMSGAEIANTVMTAAYLAAAEDTVVGMRHLVRGVLAEHRKMGRFLPDSEFGAYAPLLRADHAAAGPSPSSPAAAPASAPAGMPAATSSSIDATAPTAQPRPAPGERRAPRRVVSP